MSGFSTLADTVPADFSGQSGTAAGMTSELLDHYEVGTWTPVITGPSTISYSTQIGLYTRIGNIVRIKFRLVVTWTSSGHTILTGLPFTTGDTTGGTISIGYQNMDSSHIPTFYPIGNTTQAQGYNLDAAGSSWVAPSASGKYLVGSGTYTLQDA